MDFNVNSKFRYTVCSLIWSEISLTSIAVNVNSLIYVFNGNICVIWCSSYVLMYMCINKLQCGICVWKREIERVNDPQLNLKSIAIIVLKFGS